MAVDTINLQLFHNNRTKILENAHQGFAYELLALEIQVEGSKQEKCDELINNLSKLIQLYMLGVEVLESNFDKRYKYFNNKIQALMKKKHIIEELHIASTGKKLVPKEALVEANKTQCENRKNEHDINIFMSSDQFNIRKVKEIVMKEEAKMKVFKSRLQVALDSQETNIKDRIQRRKMKSECHSIRKLDLGSSPGKIDILERNRENDDIFKKELNSSKMIAKGQRMGSSVQKNKNLIKI